MTKCAICGGSEFLPGPGGRMARSGLPPACAGCGALERHRGLRAALSPLPAAFFADRSALQFVPQRAPDGSLDPAWFRGFTVITLPTGDQITDAAAGIADEAYDFISFSHQLEFESDDRGAFAVLERILAPGGIMQIGFASSLQAPATARFEPPKPPYGRHWDFGRDLLERLDTAARGFTVLAVTLTDSATGTSEPAHFFCRSAQDAAWLGLFWRAHGVEARDGL